MFAQTTFKYTQNNKNYETPKNMLPYRWSVSELILKQIAFLNAR